MEYTEVNIQSGVRLVRPKQLITTSVGAKGMIRLTPKKTYHIFKSDKKIKNAPNADTVVFIKDGYRWFIANKTWVINNFDVEPFMKTTEEQSGFLQDFCNKNEHIRLNEPMMKIVNIDKFK